MKRKMVAFLLILLMVASLLTGCGGSPTVKKLMLSPESTEVATNEGIKVDVGDYVLDGEAELTVTKQQTEEHEEEGYKIDSYDFKLGELKELGDFITIRIPYETTYCNEGEDPSRCVGAKYKNEETGEWEDVLFEVDKEAGEIVIYTDHLSDYGVIYVKDSGKRKAYITDILETTTYMDSSKAIDFSRRIAKGDKSVYKELMKFGNELSSKVYDYSDRLDNAINIVTAGDTPSWLSAEIPETGQSIFTAIGYLATCHTLVSIAKKDFYGGGAEKGEILNLIRDVNSKVTAYWGKALSSAGEASLSVSMGGVLILDKMLTAFGEEAHSVKMEDISFIYHHYNESFKGFGHTPRKNKEWRQMVIDAIEKNPDDPDIAIKTLNEGFEEYSNEFFNLSLEQMNEVASDVPNITMKRVPNISKAEQAELVEGYIAKLKNDTMPAVLTSVNNYMIRKAELVQLEALNTLKNYYNSNINIEIKEDIKKEGTSKYAGYTVRFSPLSKNADVSNWTATWREDGEMSTKATLIGFMLSGYPHNLDFYPPDANVDKDKPEFSIPFVIKRPKIKIEIGGVPTFNQLVGRYKDGKFKMTGYYMSDSLRKQAKSGKGSTGEMGCDLAMMLSELDKNVGVSQKVAFTIKKTAKNKGKFIFDDAVAKVSYNPDTGIMKFNLNQDEAKMVGELRASFSNDKKSVKLEGKLKMTMVFFPEKDFYCNAEMKGSKALKK